jgi:hypothetical protein
MPADRPLGRGRPGVRQDFRSSGVAFTVPRLPSAGPGLVLLSMLRHAALLPFDWPPIHLRFPLAVPGSGG